MPSLTPDEMTTIIKIANGVSLPPGTAAVIAKIAGAAIQSLDNRAISYNGALFDAEPAHHLAVLLKHAAETGGE